ncbi:hypothetical protein GQ53DRAFT_761215 [Thozetella sp. PMI_491]|nr:hypothetical protein GQ53DRAFT_761215 [Thozetella sp. PMI_491]
MWKVKAWNVGYIRMSTLIDVRFALPPSYNVSAPTYCYHLHMWRQRREPSSGMREAIKSEITPRLGNGHRKNNHETRPNPKLSNLDEHYAFGEDLAADIKNLNNSLNMLSESEECDLEDLDDRSMRLEPSEVNKWIEDLEAVCGPAPDMDSIPSIHQRNIENHDRNGWVAIIQTLLAMA